MNFVKKVIYFNIVPLIGSLFNKRSKFVNVIYYHDIVRGKGYSSQQTNVDIFKKQMKYLHYNGYVTYTFDELENTENLKFCYKHIVITFDDGWISNYTEIFDFMKSLKLKYNIFLSMGKIGVDKSYLTWDSVREMHNSGIVGFGAHSFTHPSMADVNAINPNLEIIEVDQKFKKELGYEPHDFCYPFGYYSEASNDYLVKYSNYMRIYTSDMNYSYMKEDKIIFGRNSIVNEEPMRVFIYKVLGYFNIFSTLVNRIVALTGK